MEKTPKNIILASAVILITTGKLFAVCGQSIFSLSHAYQLTANSSHCNLTNTNIALSEPEIPLIVIGTLTTLWVRGRTRSVSLWRDFGLNNKQPTQQPEATHHLEDGSTETKEEEPQQKKDDPPLFPCDDQAKLTASILVFANGLVSGGGTGIQAYLGAQVLLRLLGLTNQIARIGLAAFCGLCTLATFFSFIMKQVIWNAQRLVKTCQTFHKENQALEPDQSRKKLIQTRKNLLLTFGLCTLGNFAYATSAFFFATDTLRSLFYLNNEEVNLGLSWLVFSCTFISVFLSRVVQTYNFVEKGHSRPDKQGKLDYKTWQDIAETLHWGNGSLFWGNAIVCLLDVITYGYAFYSGAVDVLLHLGLACDSPATIVLGALTALSGGFMHYIYSVEFQLKEDGNALIKAMPRKRKKSRSAVKPVVTTGNPLAEPLNPNGESTRKSVVRRLSYSDSE